MREAQASLSSQISFPFNSVKMYLSRAGPTETSPNEGTNRFFNFLYHNSIVLSFGLFGPLPIKSTLALFS